MSADNNIVMAWDICTLRENLGKIPDTVPREAPLKKVAPNIYERPGHFQVRIKRKDAYGITQPINQSFYFDPKRGAASYRNRAAALAEAKRFAGNEIAALRIEGRRAPDDDEPLTLGELLKKYGEEITPTKNAPGQSRELAIIKGMQEHCPELCQRHPETLRAADFTGAKATSAAKRLKDAGYKPNTVRRWLALVSHAYTVARSDWGYEWANPLYKAAKPHEDDARDRVVTPVEWEKILFELRELARPATIAAIVFLRWTAARRSEAQALRWEAVTWGDHVTATLFNTKSPKKGEKKKRTIPVPKVATDEMRKLYKGDEPPNLGPVFGGFRPDALTRAWVRACHAAKIKDPPRLHDLRHTRTTEMAAVLSVHELAKITGHSDLKMLMRYYHPKADSLGKKMAEAEAAELEREKQAKARAEQEALALAEKLGAG